MLPSSFTSLLPFGFLVSTLLVLFSLPWLFVLLVREPKKTLKSPTTWGYIAGAVAALTLAVTWYASQNTAVEALEMFGRFATAAIHLNLILAMMAFLPRLVILIWPKGGAVALSAYREAIRQPIFWLVTIIGIFLLLLGIVIPYFTMGEDYKFMKQVGYDILVLAATLFGLLTASISIHEEIEGRTAITVISKPVNRRQFLIGKYIGILISCWTMILLLGWVFSFTLYVKPFYQQLDDIIDPMPTETVKYLQETLRIEEEDNIRVNEETQEKIYTPKGTIEGRAVWRGATAWVGENFAHHLGAFRVFGQVMVLLAICVALATRVSFVVNLVTCLGVFVIGNLSGILVAVTRKNAEGGTALTLIGFLARLFNAIFPALDTYAMGPAIVRESPLSTIDFIGFVGTVLLYSLLYTAMVIFIGLLLFEDRDLS